MDEEKQDCEIYLEGFHISRYWMIKKIDHGLDISDENDDKVFMMIEDGILRRDHTNGHCD